MAKSDPGGEQVRPPQSDASKMGDGLAPNSGDVAPQMAREALRQSETTLRRLIANIPDLILVVDRHARIGFANERTPSVAQENLIGSVGFTHLNPESRLRAKKLVAEAFQTGEVQRMEASTIYGHWWDCRLVPLEPDEVMIICTDVTERKRNEARLAAEQQLLRKLFMLQERERKLVSHEIHDGFLQEVVGAHMLLEAAQARWCEKGISIPDEVETLAELLQSAISQGRRMISSLRPMIIDERGLIEAIRYLLAQESDSGKVKIRLRKRGRLDRLHPIVESSVFRIVQEAITNIRRHSRATKAQIDLQQTDSQLILEIRDNGIGFDTTQVPDDRFGIRGIVERARLFGGQAAITSEPGKGTCVRAEMPLEEFLREDGPQLA